MSRRVSSSLLRVALMLATLSTLLHVVSLSLLLGLPSPGLPIDASSGIEPPGIQRATATMEEDGSSFIVGERRVCRIRFPSPRALGCTELPAPVRAEPVASPDALLVPFGGYDSLHGPVNIGYGLFRFKAPPRIERLDAGDLFERPLRVEWQAMFRDGRFELRRWDCGTGLAMRMGPDGDPTGWQPFGVRGSEECIVAFEASDPPRPLFRQDIDANVRRSKNPLSARKIYRASSDAGEVLHVRRRGVLRVLVGVPKGAFEERDVARASGLRTVLPLEPGSFLFLDGDRVLAVDELLRDRARVSLTERTRLLFRDLLEESAFATLLYLVLLSLEPVLLLVGGYVLARARRPALVPLAAALLFAVAGAAFVLLLITWDTAFPA